MVVPVPPAVITPPMTPPAQTHWLDVAMQKRADREAHLSSFPADWRLPSIPSPAEQPDVSLLVLTTLNETEREIVSSDATALTLKLRSSTYSAEQVLIAFYKVAVMAQDTTNCLTEIFFQEALSRAQALDRHLQQTGSVVGPLHGLPVSIKDHILVKGHDTSTGYISWVGKTVADQDAVVVDVLRKAGAVIYLKTANPQTLLCLETNNNVYGRTLNPYNRLLSPGGSSGGESALIAAKGSPLGVGTDIGGSIRIPAAFCGLYGFKPSVARLPHAGLMGSHDGMDNIVGVVGPIARSARDLELFCRTMSQYESWTLEHAVLEIPWRSEIAQGQTLPQRLSFAILWDDNVVRPHPPILRELERTKLALLAAGHEVIDWEPLEHAEGWDLISQLYLLDGGQEYHETLQESGEPAVPGSEWILKMAEGRAPFTVSETWKLNVKRESFRKRGLGHWNNTVSRTSTGRPVDAVICPAHATLAVPHDGVRWWGYTSQWNILDLPAAIFPCGGRLRSQEYAKGGSLDTAYGYYHPDQTSPYTPRNDIEAEVMEQWGDDGRTYEGAPIALQIVGRRLNEEKVLAMLNVVESARELLQ